MKKVIKMAYNSEFKREFLVLIIYPIIFIALMVVAVTWGYLNESMAEIFNMPYLIVSIVAGVITLFASYWLVFKRKR